MSAEPLTSDEEVKFRKSVQMLAAAEGVSGVNALHWTNTVAERLLATIDAVRERGIRCIFDPCVATWKHYHGGLPGGYENPEDPTGPPIPFAGRNPEPGAVRDYNGAVLR